jgi:hypothetical protein
MNMQLNLPILDQLKDSQNILVTGVGGGFDIFCGLPIYFALREMGKTVHLANYSFTALELVNTICTVECLIENELEGSTADIPDDMRFPYYPEGYLSQWFKQVRGEDVPIWMFTKCGPAKLVNLYRKLVDHLQIDAIIGLDGGVDSLMIGDEEGAGTLLEDSISLCAIRQLDVPVKILGCLGFGAELEVAHSNALHNMAQLVSEGAFLGACALTKQMPVYQQYEAASRFVWEQPMHHKSQINMRVVSATKGEYGNHHLYDDYRQLPVYVTPLMSLYWFFELDAVAKRSKLAPVIERGTTIEELWTAAWHLIQRVKLRPRRTIPY